ncbi:Gfo/Idh/MocA family oxidoreductase [Siminovitchia acidinfaciens]|uniref:Gfo/Idh/MocA family oxidoreductase n=1 Tax=Siminovitchia acidinfaciens TaxID=2321395 RepID=A0A429XZE8_9BACI|nr:Gfo/Idh/MocA family oxidoreductase [Siminovitchia acidinfaciens]RST74191.1 Gfo/Idh/MocA family oxidoreductase [Siminovitchia acidinfaciens]
MMNFAIVGCGFIAKKHAAAIENINDAKLVAVCDPFQAAMKPYSEEYGAKEYKELDEMLKKEPFDIVCICTPSGLHASIAEQAAASGKHIILEKPIAMKMDEANRIIRAAEENNVKLAVVHPNRFRPVVRELRSILDSGVLGTISHANCIVNWNRNQEYYDQAPWRGTKEHDGGVLMNQAIHNLDLLLWFMGQPEEVYSMEATRLRDIEAEDVSTGIIRFESGALATVQASTTVYPSNFEESITIFGENGTVKIGGKNALYFEHLEIEGFAEDKISTIKNKINADPWGTPGHEWIISDMVQAVINDRQPAITGRDGRNALQLVLAFYESATINKPIHIHKGEFVWEHFYNQQASLMS